MRAAVADDDPVFLIEHKLMYGRPNRRPVDGWVGELECVESASRYPTLSFSGNGFSGGAATIVTYGGMLPLALDAAVQRAAGSSLLGFASASCLPFSLGILPLIPARRSSRQSRKIHCSMIAY